MKKAYKWILIILWMTVIFIFSSQPAEVSNENNRFVIYILNLIGVNLDGIFGQLSNFIVRKAAHFTEYLILSILIYNAVIDEFKVGNALIISVISVFLYACTDEFHQLFVPGREGRFRDVLIDTSGGSTAIIIIYLRTLLKNKRR